jgi:hypothetical protein
MPEFLNRFTLHDSFFQRLTLLNSGPVILTIGFDLVWNNTVPEGFDTLVIRVDCPYLQRYVAGPFVVPTLAGTESSRLSDADRERLLESPDFDLRAYQGRPRGIPHPAEDETVTLTRFDFVAWGHISILHGESVRCIVMNSERQWVDASTISAAPR